MAVRPEHYRRGDIVACTSKGLVARSIRFAQRRDHEEHWNTNHIAVLNERRQGEWTIYQAEASGVTNDKTLSSVTPGGHHFVLPFPDHLASKSLFLEFIEGHVGDRYGILTIVSDALNMYLPDSIDFRRANTFTCSGLVGAALLYAGYHPMTRADDVYSITPASIVSMLQGKNFPSVAPC